MEDVEKTLSQCQNSILFQKIDQFDLWDKVTNGLSMYPVVNGFQGLEEFDVRFCLGSDRDHNLASSFFHLFFLKLHKKN